MLLETPIELSQHVAASFRKLRKAKKMTMKELSLRSGVSYSSIKRFEHTGEVSFVSLIKMASVLNAENEIRTLFSPSAPKTMEELIRGSD